MNENVEQPNGSSQSFQVIDTALEIPEYENAQVFQEFPVTESNDEPNFRVINGEPAELGDVPYQIGFKYRGSRGTEYATFCGGALVGLTTILSAAHCFSDNRFGGSDCCQFNQKVDQGRLKRTFAVAGTLLNREYPKDTDSLEFGQWRRLWKVTIPPKYKFPRNDIAVVKTKAPFVYNQYVQPISYSRHQMEYSGKCLLSGYGMISDRSSSPILMTAYIDIVPTDECTRRQGRNMHKFVCTSNTVSDAAKGDSGGPLACKNTGDPLETDRGLLVGVVSGQSQHPRKRIFSQTFYTRISSHYRFIKNSDSDEFNAAMSSRMLKKGSGSSNSSVPSFILWICVLVNAIDIF